MSMRDSISWPPIHDSAAAHRLTERFQEASGGVEDDRLVPLLYSIGGNSPYLSDLALREHQTLRSILCQGPDEVFAKILADLHGEHFSEPRQQVAARLRQAKRRAALTIAVADIAGAWKLSTVTEALSELAETCLSLASKHILKTAHDQGAIKLSDLDNPTSGCGFTILGMGKLGARELNYSSDIDLILLYDSESSVLTGGSAREALGTLMARWSRDLVTLMEARDANGYVFRTDLRLRPDPSATPPAISVLAALTYYESMGQNWERAAMIKARPVAGDLEVGEQFLGSIRPFIWRSRLDFAAIADIHELKTKIDVLKSSNRPKQADKRQQLLGYNLKLGLGGIREIEFLVQTLQMVWGGKDPNLRTRSTVESLHRLCQAQHLSAEASQQLVGSYRFLRQLEHRVQMVNDRQTHSLPTELDEFIRVAHFFGYDCVEDFVDVVLQHISTVHGKYQEFFGTPELSSSATINVRDLQGEDADLGNLIEQIDRLGFKDHQRVVLALQNWFSGHMRALRSSRAQELLRLMLPSLLAALGRQIDPDQAFGRFDRLLSSLPAGIQIMSLFQFNPLLLNRVADILGAAPVLSEYLASFPDALEVLLPNAPAEGRTLRGLMPVAGPEGLEQTILNVRRAVKEEDFRNSVLSLEGSLAVDVVARKRTLVAHTALNVLLHAVTEHFSIRHGRKQDGGMAVLALGKFGSRVMMTGSDLDLIFIYDHAPDAPPGDAPRPLAPSQWFVRLVQSFVAAVSAPGREGPMYHLDMRLRPSGNKGPLAVSLAAFRSYHQSQAWTWERMALTRGRLVAGDIKVRGSIRAAVREALAWQKNAEDIRSDAAAMRIRMAEENPKPGLWDVKMRPGGLVDVEFVVQVLQLVHAAAPGFQLNQTTSVAASRLGRAGFLPLEDVELLIQADRLWRTVLAASRLIVPSPGPNSLEGAGLAVTLNAVRSNGFYVSDEVDLLSLFELTSAAVRRIFRFHVGQVDLHEASSATSSE